MFEEYFKFPAVMTDMDKLKKREDMDLEYVVGMVELPYKRGGFLVLNDSWLPTSDSWAKAEDGEFEACHANFGVMGEYKVPYTRREFKEKINKFLEKQPEYKEATIILNDEQFKEVFGKDMPKTDEDENTGE